MNNEGKMDLKSAIDWLRFSVPNDTPIELVLPEGEAFQMLPRKIEPLPYYTHAFPLKMGGRVDWNVKRPEQKTLITFTGSELNMLPVLGVNPLDIVRAAAAWPDVRFTRLDLAIDVFNASADAYDLHRAFVGGRVKTHVQECQRTDKHGKDAVRKGATVYLGARTSERFLRCYDKAAEQGVEGDWTRLELELKRAQARRAVKGLLESTPAATAAKMLREYIQTDIAWLEAALDELEDPALDIPPAPRHEGDREVWLHEQAGPAVVQALLAGDAVIWQMLFDALAQPGE